jgi:hypothetical protein
MGIGPYEAFLALDWLGPLKRVQSMGRLSPGGVDNFAIFQTEHERGMAQLHTGLDLLSRGDALLCGERGYVTIHENWWNPFGLPCAMLMGELSSLRRRSNRLDSTTRPIISAI